MVTDDKSGRDAIMEALQVARDDEDDSGDEKERQTVVDDGYLADLRARLESPSQDNALPLGSRKQSDKAIMAAFQDRTTEKLESELKKSPSLRPDVRDSIPPPTVPANVEQLYVLCGPDAGKTHELGGGTMRVGRGPDCDLVLTDPSVSRVHIVLERREGRWHFQDQGSENGTYLDGQWMREGELGPGEPLELGRTMLVLEKGRS